MKNFGKRLTKLRKEKGLDLEELALELNLNKSGLKLWEDSKNALSIYNIIKLAKYFNVSVDYLLGL